MAKKSPGQWLFWWRVNEDEIDTQARQYKTLTFLKSSRGVATAFLLASAALTGMLILLSGDMWSLVDIGLLLFLAVFVYLGHRWAMIAAMVFWTLGKLVVIAGVFMGKARPSPSSAA